MRKVTVTALLVLAAYALTAPAQDPAKADAPKIVVQLSFTVKEYDPKAPAGSMKCVVRNDTKQAINVPVGYDGQAVSVMGSGVTLHRRVKPGKEVAKTVRVGPGQEQVVFDLPLGEILKDEGKQGDPWSWHWMRRPAPPRSPIHKYRQPGYRAQATFTARVEAGGQKLTSNAAALKVKAAE